MGGIVFYLIRVYDNLGQHPIHNISIKESRPEEKKEEIARKGGKGEIKGVPQGSCPHCNRERDIENMGESKERMIKVREWVRLKGHVTLLVGER